MHLSLVLSVLFVGAPAPSEYNAAAGKNAPMAVERRVVLTDSGTPDLDDDGNVQYEQVQVASAKDRHGNAQGTQYDLAVDGAFNGQTVLIIDQVQNRVDLTTAALKTKGFSSVVYRNGVPDIQAFRAALQKSCQVWLISSSAPQLSRDHIDAIKDFFNRGHGVYIWGDNRPLYADANLLANALLPGLGMSGDTRGDQVVGISQGHTQAGVLANHLVTTGVERLYEGITIATIQGRQDMTPLLYGSAGNLVAAAWERDGKRLVIDGGFTRLAIKWDDAGTARYVKNAAAWLVNVERFGDPRAP